MKYNIDNWPFYWFGIWKEYGEGYEHYPSIQDFVDANTNHKYDKNNIISYLKSGKIIMCTSLFQRSNPITGEKKTKTVCYRTDGKRVWLDDIIDLIENDNLCLPHSWLQEMIENNFSPPN